MLFSAILVAFFGIPIATLSIMSVFLPPSLEPTNESLVDNSVNIIIPEPLGVPITVKKIKHKGNYVWVDASDAIARRRANTV
jgi:hypothetical protein